MSLAAKVIGNRELQEKFEKAAEMLEGAEQLAARMERPEQETTDMLEKLWSLPAPPEQRERAFQGLVRDGLASRQGDEASLPG